MTRKGYDPNQPRDEIGRWTEDGSIAGNTAKKAAGLSDKKAKRNFQEGDYVKVVGNKIEGQGTIGFIVQASPSGLYFGVEDESGEFLGYYHESDLILADEAENDGEDENDWRKRKTYL